MLTCGIDGMKIARHSTKLRRRSRCFWDMKLHCNWYAMSNGDLSLSLRGRVAHEHFPVSFNTFCYSLFRHF